MCSAISRGPVAQFIPSAASGNADSAAMTAGISVPTSIVPVVSIVTCAMSGTLRPSSCIASSIAWIAILHWRMSWQVSTRIRSAPPSRRPRPCSWYDASRTFGSTWPSVGSFVPGPADPTTNRGRVRRRVLLAGRARDLGGAAVQLAGLVRDPELCEDDLVRPERVGLDRVAARGEVRLVDRLHGVRPGLAQDLHAVLEALEVRKRQVQRVERGPHRAVEDQQALLELGQKVGHGSPVLSPPTPDSRRRARLYNPAG